MIPPPRPLVLCLSGHDPGGGAGIHADIEAVGAQDAHALTVVTALTVQDTGNVRRVEAIAPALLAEQIDLLLRDSQIAAIKIGLLGSAAQLPVLADAIRRSGAPVVYDPVLRAGGGTDLGSSELIEAMREKLLPLVDLLTPNADEARRLEPAATGLVDAAQRLQARGVRQVLVTGGDEPTADAVNEWFDETGRRRVFHWSRWPARFHGAGCTLAAAIAARLALGEDWPTAIATAQRYTHAALGRAFAAGQGRLLPERLDRRPAAVQLRGRS